MLIRRRHLLQAATSLMGAGLWGGLSHADQQAPKKNLLTIFVAGGWDTTYALEPKPGAAGVDSPLGDPKSVAGLSYLSHASRPKADAFFQSFGQLCSIVNGIQVQSINHPDCAKRILTGTASDRSPDFSTIAAYELGQDKSAPLLALGPTAFTGEMGAIAVRTGTVTQLKTLMNPDAAFPAPPSASQRFRPDAAEAQSIDDYVVQRAEALGKRRARYGHNKRRIAEFLQSRERGERFKSFDDAFGTELEFSLDLRVQIDIAVRALSEGLSQSVHLETPFGWDTHTNNELQGPLQEDLFDALGSLTEKLSSTPGAAAGSKLLDETLVVVVSEMGRTPKLNAEQGKDHWPVTSALILGAGLRGGRTLGKTDDSLQASKLDFSSGAPDLAGKTLQYGNFAAGVLSAVGVDPATYLPGSEAFHALLA